MVDGFGKSTVTAYIVILHALQTKEGVSWVIAPTYPMTMIMWRMIKKFLPRDYVKEIREGDKSIELVNGHIIYAKSGDNPDALRGEGLTLVAFDEFAFIKPEVWVEAIRPALADKGGRLSSSAHLVARPSTINSSLKDRMTVNRNGNRSSIRPLRTPSSPSLRLRS